MNRKRRFLRLVKNGVKLGGLTLLILLGTLIIPLVRAGIECRFFGGDPPVPVPEAAEVRRVTADLSNYARSEEQTYLTLPEWYIVYSADEYAAFIADNPPSHFPYFKAIGQYWQSYYDVCAVTRETYPLNTRYHIILTVIGTSFTLENMVKGAYENTVGRAAEWLSSDELTAEEIYAAQVAKAYGDFIHTIPWFEFPFDEKLKGLWTETGLWGPNVIRKWERKFALSLEYGGKSIYAGLIRGGNEASFTPQDLEIQVWATGISEEVLNQEDQVQIIKAIDDKAVIAAIPRYEAFTKLVPGLAEQGVQFVEIAGNDEILITAIAPRQWQYTLMDGELLFAMEILTQPELKRVAVKTPVKSLHSILNDLADSDVEIEHIYDY